MKFKRIFLSLATVVTAYCMSVAEGTSYLHIHTQTGWEVLSLDRVERLTFKNNTMTATDANNAVVASYPQSELDRMMVNQSSGVSSPVGESANDAFSFDGASSSVLMNVDGDFEVYGLNGAVLVRIPEVKKGEIINLSAIESGTVIIKSGNNSAKVIIK